MSLVANLPAPVVETILTRLAALFHAGANGDLAAARHSAAQMLGAYNPQTEDELSLAATIISFSFHALEALDQAAAPDMPVPRILRLRGSAVSLSRESEKARRRLTQLQKARQQNTETQPEPTQQQPKLDQALNLIQETGKIATAAKSNGLSWTQSYEHRQRDLRIAASLKRAEMRAAIAATLGNPHAHPAQTAQVT